MKITKDKIDKMFADGRASGIDVRLRDVGYYILSRSFDSNELAYRLVYEQGASADYIAQYDNSPAQTFLKDWFSKYLGVETISDELSFTENKQALIDMLNEITALAADGEIPQKDAMKMKADIRVKLNDKFQVQDVAADTIVVVPPKYDMVCPYTSRECYQMNAEYAKHKFHLIDDPNYTK